MIKKSALLVFVVAAFGVLVFQTEQMMQLAVRFKQVGWMTSYLVPRVAALILATIVLASVYRIFPLAKVGKFVAATLFFGVLITIYLVVNPPYINDWQKHGVDMDASVLLGSNDCLVGEKGAAFNGLVMLALPDCPYCIEATKHLKVLKERNPDLDVSVAVAATSKNASRDFATKTGLEKIEAVSCKDMDELNRLSNGRYPAYLYLEGGVLKHRWSNSQFGFPALDWVESRMK